VDFFQDWASARNLFHGLPIYTSHEVTIEKYLGYQADRIDFPVNAHPPASVVVAIPYAALDYPDAVLAWNLVSLALFALTLWGIARALSIPLGGWSISPILVLALTCSPLRQQVNHGQYNLLLLFLLVGAWLAERSQRRVAAGVLLALATALKLFPALFFLYFVLKRQWKVVAVGIVALALVTVLTVAVLGVDTWMDYAFHVLPTISQYQSYAPNLSLWGFWSKLFHPHDSSYSYHLEAGYRSPTIARLGSIACCALIVGAIGWVVLRSRSRLERDLAFAITMTGMLLVSPVSWDHYLLLLTPALAISWTQLRSSGFDRAGFLLLLVIFWIPPKAIWDCAIPGGHATYVHALTVLSLQSYALLAFFLFSIGQWRRARLAGESSVVG
jgi:hypothetical protein